MYMRAGETVEASVHNTNWRKYQSKTNDAIKNRFLQRKFAGAGILLIFTDRTDSYEGR
jgi:hypothetical protein